MASALVKENGDHPPIWTVTTYRRRRDEGRRHRERRTVGFFYDQITALKIVEGNYGDLEEAGWYQFAVVEPLGSGLYPTNEADERVWFEFVYADEDHQEGKWHLLGSVAPKELLDDLGLERDRLTNWSEIC